MDGAEHFERTVRFRTRQEQERRLGPIIKRLMDERITPRQKKCGKVAGTLIALLPPELAEHTQVAQVDRGTIKLTVDSAAHMYELNLCRRQLLDELRRKCPRAKIKTLKFSTR